MGLLVSIASPVILTLSTFRLTLHSPLVLIALFPSRNERTGSVLAHAPKFIHMPSSTDNASDSSSKDSNKENDEGILFWTLYNGRARKSDTRSFSRASSDLEGILTFVSHYISITVY